LEIKNQQISSSIEIHVIQFLLFLAMAQTA